MVYVDPRAGRFLLQYLFICMQRVTTARAMDLTIKFDTALKETSNYNLDHL